MDKEDCRKPYSDILNNNNDQQLQPHCLDRLYNNTNFVWHPLRIRHYILNERNVFYVTHYNINVTDGHILDYSNNIINVFQGDQNFNGCSLHFLKKQTSN